MESGPSNVISLYKSSSVLITLNPFLEKYSDFIADETLAVSISEDNEESASEIFNFQIDNTEIKLSI